nr:hypothetical protein [Tanacetum cinerariifolium]
EAIRLRSQVATVEAAEAARASELDGLKERTMALEGQIAALEYVIVSKDAELASSNAQVATLTQDLLNLQLSCDELSIKDASLESKKDKVIDQVFALEGLDAELMGMALHLDEEFYPRFLTTILGRRWILSRGMKLVVMKCLQSSEYLTALGGAIGRAIDKGMQDGLAVSIDHGRSGRGLADVTAYDPSTEANFVFVVNALRVVDFPLLAQLTYQKDASIADIMDLLYLEGDAASHRLCISDAMIPLIELLFAENLVGEATTSEVLATTNALSTTFIQAIIVPSVAVTHHEGLGTRASTEVPSRLKIVFENEELETTPEHTSAY